MTAATRKYANAQQKNKKWRARAGLVANPRANFHYPRASIKARERAEMRSRVVQERVAAALALVDRVKRINEAKVE